MNSSIDDSKTANRNINDKYIEKTEILWLKTPQNYIKDYIYKNKLLGRIFLNEDSSASYYEIFEDKRFMALGMSKRITILYSPDKINNSEYDKNNIIGFRYYQIEDIKNKKCKYFTLIKKYNNRYYILEKNDKMKDIYDSPFYNTDLDCYEIINNIIYEKYFKRDERFPNGELFPELVGYSYALLSKEQFKDLIPLEPFIPDISLEESFIEKLPEKIEKNIILLEPILYGQHASLLMITFDQKKERNNIWIDMSTYHAHKNESIDITIFPKCMRNNLSIYPSYPIQKYNTCGLWFCSIINFLINNNKYSNGMEIIQSIKKAEFTFCKDIIDYLSEKFYKKIIFETEGICDCKSIKENYYYSYIDLSFSDESINNFFFNLNDYAKYSNESAELSVLSKFQKLFESITEFKKLVDLNYEYFKIYSDEKEQNLKFVYENALAKINKLNKIYDFNLRKTFTQCIISSFINYIKYDKKLINKNVLEEMRNEVKLFNDSIIKSIKREENIENILNGLSKSLDIIKNDLNNNTCFKSESWILNNLNPNNNIIFKLMDK